MMVNLNNYENIESINPFAVEGEPNSKEYPKELTSYLVHLQKKDSLKFIELLVEVQAKAEKFVDLVKDIDSIRTRTLRRFLVSTSIISSIAVLLNGHDLIGISIFGFELHNENYHSAYWLLAIFLIVASYMLRFSIKRDLLSFRSSVQDLTILVEKAKEKVILLESDLKERDINLDLSFRDEFIRRIARRSDRSDKIELSHLAVEGLHFTDNYDDGWAKAFGLTEKWREFDRVYPYALALIALAVISTSNSIINSAVSLFN